MTRQSRTFKLRLSPEGMDLLIDSHCHLIRSTRALLPWGTTLYVAVDCLDSAPVETVREQLARLPNTDLSGPEEHHLGAPKVLSEIAVRIAKRVGSAEPGWEPPALAHIYIVALQQLTRTDAATLRAAYNRLKPPASQG